MKRVYAVVKTHSVRIISINARRSLHLVERALRALQTPVLRVSNAKDRDNPEKKGPGQRKTSILRTRAHWTVDPYSRAV